MFDDLCDMLFEVSNDERYMILHSLSEEPRNLTSLAKRLRIRVTQTSRHMNRLTDVGLVQKNNIGHYELTQYGSIVLRILGELQFLVCHNKYFQTHRVDVIPFSRLTQISQLNGSMYLDNAFDFMTKLEEIIVEASDFLCISYDVMTPAFRKTLTEAILRGIPIEILEPLGISPSVRTVIDEYPIKVVHSLKVKQIQSIPCFQCINESKSLLALPSLDGKLDYTGFFSVGENSVRWGLDIFRVMWNA